MTSRPPNSALPLAMLLLSLGCTAPDPYYCDQTKICAAELVCDLSLRRCLTARLYARQPTFPAQGIDYKGIWSNKPDAFFAIGSRGEATRLVEGATWYSLTQVPLALQAIWGFDEKNVWAVGLGGTILRLNQEGIGWDSEGGIPQDVELLAIFGLSPTAKWAVGGQGKIFYNDGVRWSEVASNTTRALAAIHATSPTDVWAAGEQGIIIHYDGQSWKKSADLGINLYSLWAAGPFDVWAAGQSGVVAHWNGTDWHKVATPASRTLYSLWGNGQGVLWAVGATGLILRFNGSNWVELASDVRVNLSSVWGDISNSVTIVGEQGTLLSYLLRQD